MAITTLKQACVHPSWHECLQRGLSKMDSSYLAELEQSNQWLPGEKNLFNAFSLPLEQVNYILFGESPYPRSQSANGYAFWDAAVSDIWSPQGLNKTVNRATSLRNMIKMLLVAAEKLDKNDTSQTAIAKINKQDLIQHNHELFAKLIKKGFLLLNASLVLQKKPGSPKNDAKAWHPFIQTLLEYLFSVRPHVTVILFGQIANNIDKLLPSQPIHKLYAEHPYNLSFITNTTILNFFKPLRLLQATP